MLKTFSFHRLAILSVALAAPGLLQAGANTWTGNRLGGASLSSPALVASSASDPNLVYSAQGHDLFRSVDGGLTWDHVGAFDRIDSLYVTASGAVLVGARQSGPLAFPGIYKSSEGAVWRQTFSISDGAINLFAASSGAPSTLYASTDGIVYRSGDGGETWGAVSLPVGQDRNLLRQIAALIVRPADGTLYAGGYDYDSGYYGVSYPVGPFLRKSSDHGDSWTDLEVGGLDGIDVSAIAFDPINPATIYAGSGTTPDHHLPTNSLWRSDDGGAHWALAQSGLPSHASISGLVVDPGDPKTVYAATDSGVYRTRNSGASWFPFGQLLYGSPVGSLTLESRSQNANERVLRVGGTYGVYELEIGAGALDVAAGVGRSHVSHVLSWDADSLTVQTLDDSGASSGAPPEGPASAWLATAISDGPDGLSRVLWVAGDGRAALEIVGPAGRQAVFQLAAVTNWSPVDVSAGSDGASNLLWRNQTGAMYLARVDASGNVTLGPSYGPYPGWIPLALADSPDGAAWVLWRAADGRASVSVHRDLVMQEVFRFPAVPDLAPVDITVGTDGNARLLRVGADGTAEVSTIDASGNLSDAQTHNPGGRPRRIAAGPDGFTRLLFSDGSGAAVVLLLNSDNSLHTEGGSEPGPPDPGSPEPQPPGSIVGDWTGTFTSVDFVDCDSPSPASATFTREGSAIDGILHMTTQGCGAENVLFHGTMVAGRVRGSLERGGGPSHYVFVVGSTAEGVLDGTRLELTLLDNSPSPFAIPGGTMTLHR